MVVKISLFLMPLCSTSCPNLMQKWLGVDATGYAQLTSPQVQNSECTCTGCMPSSSQVAAVQTLA